MENIPGSAMILRGGRVIDPANGLDQTLDVAIAGGKIVQVAAAIPAAGAAQVLDVSGMIVTPGLLDIHTHVYPHLSRTPGYVDSVRADAHLLASGVTTTVDVGTTGWKDFLDFKELVIDQSQVRILALLNIASGGMLNSQSEQTLAEMQPQVVAGLVQAFPEILLGVKTAHYWTSQPWDELHPPWGSVDRALEAAALCGKFVMVDFWPRPPERAYPDLILKKLRPGDIHTHVFAQQFPILSDSGRTPQGVVNEYMFEARQRGVIFDLGHGAGSFWFRNAVRAYRNGFGPDTISTDLHMGNINGPVLNLLTTMSKYLNIGMPLVEVIERATCIPARVIGRPELGSLSVGAEADVAVLQKVDGACSFTDCGRARMSGSQKLECRMTLRAGKIVYDPGGMSLPDWEQAPAPYWVNPTLAA